MASAGSHAKECRGCGRSFPATPEHFHAGQGRNRQSLRSKCKPCEKLERRLQHAKLRASMPCAVSGCSRGAYTKESGLCAAHLRRRRIYGDPDAARRIREYHGVGYVNAAGYRMMSVKLPSGRFGQRPEHRIVMEKHLGRPLLRSESVHHKNGNRSDNRIENLELWVKCQPAGQRVEDLIAYAHRILELYGPKD